MAVPTEDSLQARHAQLQQDEPKLRIRDRALRLGVTEAELVAADCGVTSTALAGSPQELFGALGALGTVMALSRNDHAVHERHGSYLDIQANGPVGIVLGPDIDLRMFFGSWKHFYAVTEHGRQSLQFFDKAGMAVHKIYRTEQTDGAAWDAYAARFAAAQKPEVLIEPFTAPVEPDAPSDAAGLRSHWLALKDTHDFFTMLRQFKVSRVGALRAAGEDLAQPVEADAVERMLTGAAETRLPIMCFVANRGIVQIHTGPVQKLLRTGPWFNVLDASFNLHLNTEAVASSWVVRKPTTDGWVTSLELFGAGGELIVQFFGARKPGQPELEGWRELLQSLSPQALAA
ncbi:hemin-degrading factor [Comamonas endophytica]|uniref:Hemin-degrading factor n=1 Tax=Comamonas endophytica TaxID=2949090 RepID=A0ABY6GAK6_9BURK|nr:MULTISPECIES: ChuX/HutX family heme-like substrate-binding protein [unclassified Acidovorax]MCD2513897.1 hemin-degrading factor [Acidovorax sp. D4N7]UYG52107.1 hemin-degrading factor [Acidovorax sp. 5MLIR]